MKLGKLNPKGAVEYDCWEKVYETILTSAASSVSITGLEGDTDEQYMLDVLTVGVGFETTYLLLNGDTGSTYGHQQLVGNNTSLTANRAVVSVGFSLGKADAGDIIPTHVLINAKSGFVRTCLTSNGREIDGTTVARLYVVGQSWNNTADELTSMTISNAENLGVGSSISLYRRISA